MQEIISLVIENYDFKFRKNVENYRSPWYFPALRKPYVKTKSNFPFTPDFLHDWNNSLETLMDEI